jgi:ferredoxin-NADP reductase
MQRAKNKWMAQALTNHNSFKDFIEPIAQLIRPNWQSSGCFAQVVNKRIESKLVYSLILKPSKKWPIHIAGQHVSIQVEINGVRYHRIFSISCSPSFFQQSGLIELTIRLQDHGKVTQWMAKNLESGDAIRISEPQGQFTLPLHNQPLLLIAGGSGITPFRSFIHQLNANNATQDIHLVYYNQSTTPLFLTEWQQLNQSMHNFKVSLIDTDVSGLISAEQITDTCPDLIQRTAYLCGPYGLITTSRDILIELGVDSSNIHHELFGPKPISTTKNNTTANLDDDLVSQVTFSQSNKKVDDVAQQTLLEVAESAALNPPSGCRMGICHQCKCTKQQGVVYNTLTNTYSDTGTEDIQLCISMAVGDVTLVL